MRIWLFLAATAVICSCIEPSIIQTNDPYYISATKETFLQALSDCKMLGMNLAVIESDTEQVRLTSFLDSTGAPKTNVYWLGGFHRDGDVWVWLDLGEIFQYTHWDVNEPFHSNNPEDHCLKLVADGHGNSESTRAWATEYCDLPLQYICQK